MARDDHPLDLKFLANELWGFMPPPVRLILQHFLSLHADATTALVLPSEAASYLALEHPRIKGSAQLGIKSHDRITVLPNTLSPEQLAMQIPSNTTNLIAFFHNETLEVDNDEAFMLGQRTEACLSAVTDGVSVDLVLPARLIQTDEGAGMREFLIARGQVTDLFDGGTYWYVGWLAEPPEAGHRTQVVEVPPPDEWSDFAEDLRTWMPLWRWGDLTILPADRPWEWKALRPDLVSMLLRLRAQMEDATTSTPPSTVAHARLDFIELSLRYLVELRIGDDPARILPLLSPTVRNDVQAMMFRSERVGVLSHVHFISFKHIIQRAWSAFAPLFHDGGPSKQQLARSLQALNDVRNRTAHPSSLTRITLEDLARLSDVASTLDKAIENAETLRQRDAPESL